MSATVSPVIVIPGITASDLFDQYELPPEAVWTTMRQKRYDRITLHPADQRYEFNEPARVKPGGPFPLVYGELVEELRDGLSEGHAGPVPVFPFGYDWRMPLDQTEARLDAFVREVIDRTLLMPLHRADPDFAANPTVTLIGHSMGGLIIAGYLERYSAARVDKVVTLATPFQGSWEAVLKLTTGTGDLGDDSGKARERHAARMTPALYHLLPSYGDGLTAEDGLELDIFHPDAWQPSVVRTIEGTVGGWDISGAELFADMLGAARAHRDRIGGLRFPVDRWLAIVGADDETRVGLRVRRGDDDAPRFDLRSAERRNQWDSGDDALRLNSGDGTVPLEGAVAPFLGESRLVCVTPRDFGYWELKDRALTRFTGLHGLLPTMNMVHRMILRFLLGKDDPYGNTWGRRFPGVAVGEWQPPLPLAGKG
ncbi:MAG: alpha/beta hydrolase [Gemmatimonadetes bacterium]|nr:alpha/beta hydrolase [Gemmatimonadota bacterium]